MSIDLNATAQSVAQGAAPVSLASGASFRLTPAAVLQVKDVVKTQKLEGHCLTVRVIPAGCSGFGYDLNLLPAPNTGDLVWEQDGISICTDAMSNELLGGTVVDYAKGDLGAGFRFENPRAKSTCGCGSSFST
jgi:iron-sulfur cluster assembly accessory protein